MASTHTLKGRQQPEGYETMTAQERTFAMNAPAVKKIILPMYDPKFDFDDIVLIPEAQTTIASRYNPVEVNPYYKNELSNFSSERLPLFTAPMDTVVDIKTMFEYRRQKVNVVLPRTEQYKSHSLFFNSFGLKDKIEEYSLKHEVGFEFALLDIANGHMKSVISWCENLKRIHPKVKIMAGNIANPKTYEIYCKSGVIDYARVGIGNGNGCLTTQQTGVGYPMGSLIAECNEIKRNYPGQVRIVADGGMKKPADVIKALALGADYVMIGSLFAKALESAAPNYLGKIKIGKDLAGTLYGLGLPITKEFRGMSTKQAQKALGKTDLKTSEGVVRRYKVEYTLSKFLENFESYLRSTMSYMNSPTLESFIGNVDYTLITNNAFNRYNK